MQRSFVSCHGVRTLVTETGQGYPLLCLHGWGAEHASFTELRDALRDDRVRVIAPDLPGCGESADPPSPWDLDDFVAWLEDLVGSLRVPRYAILGHSHGGRIAIAFAAKQPAQLTHLYLSGAAGIGGKRGVLRGSIFPALAKVTGLLLRVPGLRVVRSPLRRLVYRALRAHDYERSSAVMKATMTRMLDYDLTPLLGGIQVPTDIFWGANDTQTPLAKGETLNKKIVQSLLHVFPGVRHRVHRDRAAEIAKVIRSSVLPS